jgi:hypothetical protein
MHKERGTEVINVILAQKKNIRVFYGDATTVNHYDKN